MVIRELRGRQEINDESGKAIGLYYFLVNENDYYKIEVVKDMGEFFSSEITYPIAKSRDYVIVLLDILQRNKVTPMCLLEHVDELLN